MPIIVLGLIVAAAVSGGVSVAANNTLPGDALYGIKIGVNEQVQSALAMSGEAQANFDIKALERRLDEAEKLSAEGRLNAETFATIEANFDAHAQRVADRIADFEAKENFDAAADIAAKFQTSLEAHAAILARLSAEADITAQAVLHSVSAKVRTLINTASSVRANAETQSDAKANASGSATGADASGSAGANTNVNASSSGSGASGSGSVEIDIDL